MDGTSFVALYRGQTISSATLIAVSSDAALVAAVADYLLHERSKPERDAILASLERGRRDALRLIHEEAQREP